MCRSTLPSPSMIPSNPLCLLPNPHHFYRKQRPPVAQGLAILCPLLVCFGLLFPNIAKATILPAPTVTNSSAPYSGTYLGSWAVDQADSEFLTTQGVGTFLEFDLGAVRSVDGFVNVTLVDAGRQIGANRLIFDTDGTPGFNAATDTVRSFTQAQTGSLGQGIIQRFDAVSARYARWEVQAVVAAPTLVGMTEVAFLGTESGSNALPSTAVTVIGSAPPYSAQFAAANAANGVAGRSILGGASGIEYASNGAGANTYVDFDLGENRPILGFDLFDRINPGERTTSFDLIFSNSPTFSTVVATKSYSKATEWTATDKFAAVNARYVRYDVTSGGTYAGLGEMTFYLPAAPQISAIEPDSGSRVGGTAVVLIGQRFDGTTLVTFDGTPATGVNVINDTTLTCITPAHAEGAVDVEVTTPFGVGNRIDFYTYTNPTPTDLAIDVSSTQENSSPNTQVGTITAVDDAGDTHTFTLVAGSGSTDNASFTLLGSTLRLTPSSDFETKNSYSVRGRATDTSGGFFEKAFTISITNVNEMPSFTKGADQSAPATTSAQSVAGWATAINDGDSTVVQGLIFNITGNSNPGLFTAGPEISSTGTLTYTPSGIAGAATITVTLTDDASINGTAALTTAAQSFNITMTDARPTLMVDGASPSFIDWVDVGHPGNAADPADGDHSTAGIQNFGAVPYAYKIGKYEVTNAQYTEFLNAVDPTGSNANGIYEQAMGNWPRGGIAFTSNAAGGAKYSVRPSMGDKPVNFVSWYDAARFTNWLHNGLGLGSTETGAYTLSGNTGIITKNVGATVWIPSEDEWYKAAYYDPTPGAGGGDNYWTYPTQSNTAPTKATANATGDVRNPGANVANFDSGANWNNEHGNVTTVGSAAANNYFGTADQGGNVRELNDSIIGLSRGMRGGDIISFNQWMGASYGISWPPSTKGQFTGFRVASVSERVLTELEGSAITQTGTFSDPNGNSTVTLTASSGSISQDNSTGIWTWTATGSDGPATSTVTITATDTSGNTATAPFTFNVTNVPPTVAITAPATGAVGASIGFTFTTTDVAAPDQTAGFTWSLDYGDGTAVQTLPAGTASPLVGTHTFATAGTYTVMATATDKDGGMSMQASKTITLTNPAPTDITLSAASIAENNAANATVGSLIATDNVGDTNTFSLVTGTGSTDNASFTIAGTALKLTPSADFETKNSYDISIRTTDSIGGFFEKAFTISISNVNEIPSFTKGGDQSIPATTSAQSVAGWATAINDGDNTVVQGLTFNITGNTNPGLFTTGPAISNLGTLTYTPAGIAGIASITVTLTDDSTINGTAALTTAQQTFNITVSAPEIAIEHPLGSVLGGSILAWGWNGAGQTNVPAGLTGVIAIAAGGENTVALKSDGTIVVWGDFFYGQMNVPAGLSGITAISVGSAHIVALKNDGTVVAWGLNDRGQRTVPAGLTGVTAIAAGAYHTVALKNNGTVVAWGSNNSGQTTVPAGLTGVTAISAGTDYTVALKSDGTVVAWGWGAYGQTTVPAGLTGVTAISAGFYHTLALKNDGTVVAWGHNGYGQTNVPVGLSGVTAISAGLYHNLALKSDGTVVAWCPIYPDLATVPAELIGATAIATGHYHTVALTSPTIDFGSQIVATTSAPKTITIKNTGTDPLTINGISTSGSNASDFSVNTTGMLTSVPAGGSTTFDVSFTPSDVGPRQTTLRILNNDYDEGTFDITLTGTGIPSPNVAPSFNLATDAGASWSPRFTNQTWYDITSSADGTKLAAIANNGFIYTSTDAGVNWTPRGTSGLWGHIVSSADGTKLATTEYNGNIYTSTDSGVTWIARATGTIRQWYGIACSSDGTKLVASDYGGYLYTSTDSGVTWTATKTDGNRNWYGTASSADGTKLAAIVNGGEIYTSTDSGATWSVSGPTLAWSAITSSADGTKLAATTFNDQIYTSTDSGATWTARESSRSWYAIASSAAGSKLAAAANGLIYTSADSGVSWTPRATSLPWHGITMSADGNRLAAVATGGQVHTSQGTAHPSVITCSGPASIPGLVTNISPGPSNESAQTVSFTVTNDNNALFTVQPAIAPDGTLTFTPCCTAGTAVVTVIAVDNGGTANGGIDTSAPQTFTTTVTDPLDDWRMLHFGSAANSGIGANTNDADHDGLANLIEFAFGQNPNSGSSLQTPPAVLAGGNLFFNYTVPSDMGCITYEAEWSTDLIQWFPIPDTGTGNSHIFSVPVGNNPKMFLRHRITEH